VGATGLHFARLDGEGVLVDYSVARDCGKGNVQNAEFFVGANNSRRLGA
jgi:hypothetical protein